MDFPFQNWITSIIQLNYFMLLLAALYSSLILFTCLLPLPVQCSLQLQNKKNVSSSTSTGKVFNLRHDRVLVDDFITFEEAQSLRQLIVEFESDPHFIRLYKGLNGTDARRLFLETFNDLSSSSSAASSTSSSRYYNRRYRNKNLRHPKFKYVINTTRLSLIRNFVNIFDKIAQFTIDTFQQDLVIQTVGVSVRDGPWATIHQKYPGFNNTLWNQPPHVDQCYAEFTKTCIRCRPNSYLFRDFSVVLYLNEVKEGGDFVFLDFADNPIEELSLPTQLDSTQNNIRNRSPQAKMSNSSHLEYVDFEKLGIFKTGKYTVIPPRPGRLLVFQSGLTNIHGVTEIFDPTVRRYTFAMWFLNAARATHVQPPEPTVKPESR